MKKRDSLSAYATEIGKSAQALSRNCQLAGVRPGKDGKYSAASVIKAHEAAAERDNRNASSSNAKDVKIRLECAILRAKLDQLRGKMVDIDNYYADMITLSAINLAMFDDAESAVEMVTRDEQVLKAVKSCFDHAREKAREKVAELELARHAVSARQ